MIVPAQEIVRLGIESDCIIYELCVGSIRGKVRTSLLSCHLFEPLHGSNSPNKDEESKGQLTALLRHQFGSDQICRPFLNWDSFSSSTHFFLLLLDRHHHRHCNSGRKGRLF